jgi:TIR domain
MPSIRTAKVFIAYSNLDTKYLHDLEQQLTLLSRKGHLEWWSEHQLTPGEETENSIADALQNADLILLLISIHFLANDFCWSQQLKKAIARHDSGQAVVIPIFVRPCVWEGTPIEKLQGVPPRAKPISKWPDKHEAWTQVAIGIQKSLNLWHKNNDGSCC